MLVCGEELSHVLPHGGVQRHTKPGGLAASCFIVMLMQARGEGRTIMANLYAVMVETIK